MAKVCYYNIRERETDLLKKNKEIEMPPLKKQKGIDTMTNTKMTYGKALDFVLADTFDLPADVRERLTALRESIAKKNSAERKPTKAQIANEGVKSAIEDFMERDHLYTAAEIGKGLDISPNKAAALLKQMFESGVVVITTEKRKNYYALA